MLSSSWRSNAQLVIVVTSMLAFSFACSSARLGYIQPQPTVNFYQRPASYARVSTPDTLPADVAQTSLSQPPQPVVVAQPGRASQTNQASAASPAPHDLVRHHNPESQPVTRFRRLFSTGPIAHVAPRPQTPLDHHSPARKTHRLALVALGLAGLAYVPVLLAGASTLAWVLGLALPLTAVLLAVASLTAINRNKDRFRGKGWAMAAVLLGTGVLGLALVALAALSVSNVVLEKK